MASALMSRSIAGRPARLTQRATRPMRASRQAVRVQAYQVTFEKIEDGSKVTVQNPGDKYILDIADAAGLDLPCVCRSGTCGSCAVRLVEGDVDFSDMFITIPSLDTVLSEEQIADGLVPGCRSKPTSDVLVQWSEAGLQ